MSEEVEVTLTARQWEDVLSVMELGIDRLHDLDFEKVANSRQSIYDEIDSEVPGTTLSELEDELDMSRSRHVEETGRTVAHLRD